MYWGLGLPAKVGYARAEKYVENVSNVEKNLDKALEKMNLPAQISLLHSKIESQVHKYIFYRADSWHKNGKNAVLQSDVMGYIHSHIQMNNHLHIQMNESCLNSNEWIIPMKTI